MEPVRNSLQPGPHGYFRGSGQPPKAKTMLIFWESRLCLSGRPVGSTAVEAALEGGQRRRPAARRDETRRSADLIAAISAMAAFRDRRSFRHRGADARADRLAAGWYRFRLRDDDEDPDHAMTGVSFAEFARIMPG